MFVCSIFSPMFVLPVTPFAGGMEGICLLYKSGTVRMLDKKDRELTKRERDFCENYIRTRKKGESALLAGYSQKSASSAATKLLKKENVIAYIRAREHQIAKDNFVSADYLLLQTLKVLNDCTKEIPLRIWNTSSGKWEDTGKTVMVDHKNALKAISQLYSYLDISEDTKAEVSKLYDALIEK